MTERCDLCGRAYARSSIVPYHYPHDHVCDRSRCRDAVADALDAQLKARDRCRELAAAIAARQGERAQFAARGYRQDAMSEQDVAELGRWWGTEVVKDAV